MYFTWLDKWDERQSEIGLEGKVPMDFAMGGDLAFPRVPEPGNVEEFINLAELSLADKTFYIGNGGNSQPLLDSSSFLHFKSDEVTDIPDNNEASARITHGGNRKDAIIVFHHWGAKQRNDILAKIIASLGISVVELALPYHLERSRSPSDSDLFVSPNLGRTIQSLRQGVLDGQRLVNFLKNQRYENVYVLGTSLGSWVAALVAAHNDNVSKAALMLVGGSAADVVWTGRATRLVRESLELNLTLEQLRRAWCTLNLNNFADQLSRPGLEMLVVLGQRDKVVRPEVSNEFIARLESVGTKPRIRYFNCGHRSLGRFPYNVMALHALVAFLRR